MFSLGKKLSANLIPLILISFVLVSIFGMRMSMEMRDGQMPSCPFVAGQAAMCQMNIIEHIAKWQQAFLGIPTKASLLALAILLLAVVIIPFAKQFSQFKKLTEFAARLLAYHKTYFIKVFDPLLLSFSDGILNPRIYAPARI